MECSGLVGRALDRGLKGSAAVYSKVVVLLLIESSFIVAVIVCRDSMLVLVLFCSNYFLSSFCDLLDEEERAGCFTFLVFCGCSSILWLFLAVP